MNSSELQDVRSQNAQTNVRHLVDLAVHGLPQMFDENTGLFCNKLKKTTGGLVQEGFSPRYTAMTLMGLHRLAQSGIPAGVNTKSALERLLADTHWVDNIGDLGLVLWLAAQVAPERLDELAHRLKVQTALSRFADVREGTTMHLAWFLTGLSNSYQVSGETEPWKRIARDTYSALIQNQGQSGYFGHQASQSSLKGSLRGHIGSFADQVYPVYGMSQYFQAFGDESALRRASSCARAICRVQGALGQWWWHYDSRAGQVFEEYPVYSVHQHGMGPMALFALSKASGENFDPWIHKGLDWINKGNELSFQMDDTSASVIWRCIRQSSLRRFSGALLSVLGKRQNPAPAGLSVLFECWPYELGWLLYALAESLPKAASVAPLLDAPSEV